MNNSTKSSKLFDQLNKLNFFDKINVVYIILFLLIALIFPFALLSQLWEWGNKISIKLFDINFWKTDVIILILLGIELFLSINHKFKRFYLNFTGISSDIYARLILKFFMFGLLITSWDLILYFKTNISQSIWFGIGYYLLGIIVVGWLILDYLFLQRKYKLDKRYKTMQVGIDHNAQEEIDEWGDNFSWLFDQEESR